MTCNVTRLNIHVHVHTEDVPKLDILNITDYLMTILYLVV